MRTYSASSVADPGEAWALYARPDRWHEWSPHLRGAWGLGGDEVRPGAVGAARLLGVVPVPARIESVDPPRSWTWRVGGTVLMRHRVEPRDGGCEVALDLSAPAPLEAVLHRTYGPVIRVLLRSLARVAARGGRP